MEPTASSRSVLPDETALVVALQVLRGVLATAAPVLVRQPAIAIVVLLAFIGLILGLLVVLVLGLSFLLLFELLVVLLLEVLALSFLGLLVLLSTTVLFLLVFSSVLLGLRLRQSVVSSLVGITLFLLAAQLLFLLLTLWLLVQSLRVPPPRLIILLLLAALPGAGVSVSSVLTPRPLPALLLRVLVLSTASMHLLRSLPTVAI